MDGAHLAEADVVFGTGKVHAQGGRRGGQEARECDVNDTTVVHVQTPQNVRSSVNVKKKQQVHLPFAVGVTH